MKNSGNTIIITGGGSGIGRLLAQQLHDAGNTVIIAGRDAAKLAETMEGYTNMHALPLDQTSPASIDAFTARITSDFPQANVLINNAGIMRMEGTLASKRDLADAEESITNNLLGPIRLTDALIEHLVAQPDAALVNVTSGLAFVPLVIAPTYSAIKAGIHNYTVSLRAVLRGKVEVIEIAPPALRTTLTPGQENNERFMLPETFVDQVMEQLQRDVTPVEVLVEEVDFMRRAGKEDRFEETVAAINPFLAK
jgi:uncharacterized oxidoreductase